jgi:hypothetical protein
MLARLERQACSQAEYPARIFLRVQGRVDQQLHTGCNRDFIGQVPSVVDLGRVLIIQAVAEQRIIRLAPIDTESELVS